MQGVRRDRYYNIQRRANAKDGIRHIACATGMDRNTISPYLRIAVTHRFTDTVPDDKLAEIASAVIHEVHGSDIKNSKPSACAPPLPHRDLLSGWQETDKLTLEKVHIKLGRMGVAVTYSTLYRYVREEPGF
jgi:hypothetical protein